MLFQFLAKANYGLMEWGDRNIDRRHGTTPSTRSYVAPTDSASTELRSARFSLSHFTARGSKWKVFKTVSNALETTQTASTHVAVVPMQIGRERVRAFDNYQFQLKLQGRSVVLS